MSAVQSDRSQTSLVLERGTPTLLVACTASAVLAYGAADYRQGMWLVWTVPFVVAIWAGYVLRPAANALVVGLAYGLALLPAVGLAVHQGSTDQRLMESLTSGRAALFGIPLALLLGLVAYAVSLSKARDLDGPRTD